MICYTFNRKHYRIAYDNHFTIWHDRYCNILHDRQIGNMLGGQDASIHKVRGTHLLYKGRLQYCGTNVVQTIKIETKDNIELEIE